MLSHYNGFKFFDSIFSPHFVRVGPLSQKLMQSAARVGDTGCFVSSPADITDMARRIPAGDLRALARAATWVENQAAEAEALLEELFPKTGRALVIGVTGPPGAGKSTLSDQLIEHYRGQGKSVGVIAVDPSSPYSGGAILGDRIRMQRHHEDPGVFIRSMATRGWLGGLARAALEMTLLLDAAGREVILVETVGVGQDEVEIARLAGVTLVVLVPGMGDDIQAIKAGILEIADVFAINKVDLPGADRLERELKASMQLAHGKQVPIVKTRADEGERIGELTAAIGNAVREMDLEERAAIWAGRLREMLRERLLARFTEDQLLSAGREIAEGRQDPFSILRNWTDG